MYYRCRVAVMAEKPVASDTNPRRPASSGDTDRRRRGTDCTSDGEAASSAAPLTRRGALASASAFLAGGIAGCAALNDSSWDLPETTKPEMVTEMDRPKIGGGDGTAPTRISVFSDFLCPDCATWHHRVLHPVSQELIEPGQAVLVHYDFPLPVDERFSWPVAYAARAVLDDAGEDFFWGFAQYVYEKQDTIDSLDVVVDMAEDQGADPESVGERINNQTYYPVVRDDKRAGKDMGVDGTPTVLVGGDEVDEPTVENIIAAVRS